MKIVIFGSGNVAWVFGHLFRHAGQQVLQVIARNPDTGKALASSLSVPYSSAVSDADKDADVYLLAVSDNALYSLPAQLPLSRAIVVHTAGAVGMEVLQNHARCGVLYPLQSMQYKPAITDLAIPLLVYGNDDAATATITQLAQSISSTVQQLNDEQRLALHLAAVLVNNFTNHLYALASNFCKEQQVPFELLYPIITHTATQIKGQEPHSLQTGPALRQDTATMQKHIMLLQKYPGLRNLYLKLSESIINSKKSNPGT
jgi:predicted short-subunit dehydrogenase-like oxidoreductase (DUF2520 family)